MTVYIKIELQNGHINIIEINESEVKESVSMIWDLSKNKKNNKVVNVTVIRKGLQ